MSDVETSTALFKSVKWGVTTEVVVMKSDYDAKCREVERLRLALQRQATPTRWVSPTSVDDELAGRIAAASVALAAGESKSVQKRLAVQRRGVNCCKHGDWDERTTHCMECGDEGFGAKHE
jgi:hypothetical protein